jgi:hypothetical protein
VPGSHQRMIAALGMLRIRINDAGETAFEKTSRISWEQLLHTRCRGSKHLLPSRKARVSTKIEGPPGEGPGHHMLVGWLRRRAEAVKS